MRETERGNNIPVVFISSTVEDLKTYRAAARDAAIEAGLHPVMQEYFVASGDRPPLQECLNKVSEADVLMVIVAHRYGWVPPEQPGGGRKSITWLECERAARDGIEVLAFLVDKGTDWPEQLREEYRVTAALRDGRATPELLVEVQRNLAELQAFRRWLEGRGVRATFSSPADLKGDVAGALYEWRKRHRGFAELAPACLSDPRKYLESLREQTAWIDIRGLQVGTGRAHRFPIEELYVPLTTLLQRIVTAEVSQPEGTSPVRRYDSSGKEIKESAARRIEVESVQLQQALTHRRLMIVGDPGSGKTTFIRYITNVMCLTLLGQQPAAAQVRLGLERPPLPIALKLSEFAEHILNARDADDAPSTAGSPEWIIHFLNTRARESNWGLHADYFRQALHEGRAIVLLDGLDEAPGRGERQVISHLISDLARAYSASKFVATSRPQGYIDSVSLLDFEHVQIEPFDDVAVESFLDLWTIALYPESQQAARAHRDELLAALASRPEIRLLAQNPVMLTALAVVHWNEKRLPEQRADLYESILVWLSRSREQRVGRAPADRCLALLKQLALAMQDHSRGRHVQVPKVWAARSIMDSFRSVPKQERLEHATRFLDEEEIDSGIVVSRGKLLQFWHLTFQEYLAARAIAGLPERDQRNILLLNPSKLYSPDWHEVALLAAGVLHGQGVEKVDSMLSTILDNLSPQSSLTDKARCVGLIGALLRDLAPLRYQTADARYAAHLQDIRRLFDYRSPDELGGEAKFSIRLEAAEALAEAGFARLGTDERDDWVLLEEEGHAFEIGRYLVSVGEYRRFLESKGFHDESYWTAVRFDSRDTPLHWDYQLQHSTRPIVGVRWHEAVAYCSWLGWRLPTGGEWDRAACGRMRSSYERERPYPWGKAGLDPERLNYDSLIGFPTPVGMYPLGATPEGVYDLFGNVWEWVQDEKRFGRAVRGGYWGSKFVTPRQYTYTSISDWDEWQMPGNRHENVGFRCARDVR